jgi:hypothetical protein
MGEARRRRDNPTEIKGPVSYQIGSYRLDDILAWSVMTFAGERPSAQALAILRAVEHLAERMQDPKADRRGLLRSPGYPSLPAIFDRRPWHADQCRSAAPHPSSTF